MNHPAIATAWSSLMAARRSYAAARAALEATSPRLRPLRRTRVIHDKNGISCNRKELRALLESAAKEQESRDLYGVHFRKEGGACFARASNGRVSIQIRGIADSKQPDGEWLVTRKFLVDGKKELEGKQVLSLEFSGKSLHDAVVRENNVPLLTVTANSDAAVSQASFPAIEKHTRIPAKNREIAHCMAIGSAYLKAVQYCADAVGDEHVEWFPPKDADSPVVFRVGSDKDTEIIGCIMPVPSNQDSEEGEEAPKKRTRKSNPRQPELTA